MKQYIVGGAIRDLLLGRHPREVDVCFEGSVEAFISRNPKARKAGNSFPICILNGIEYAPLRGQSIHEDLAARDFTINAIALDQHGKLHAHPNTFHDLAHKILSPASPNALADDPVRVFRAARFIATLTDFTISNDCIEQMRRASKEETLSGITQERIALETLKALSAPSPEQYFATLNKAESLSHWYVEVDRLIGIPAGPAQFHNTDAFQHTLNVMKKVAGDPLAVYMALCHDLGKATTPGELLPKHHGHDKRGAELARNLGTRIGLPNKYIRAGEIAAQEHMKGKDYKTLRAGTKVDLLMKLNKQSLLIPFFQTVYADSGNNHLIQAKDDLAAILAVALPSHKRNLGEESGKYLRELRCKALTQPCRS